MSEIQRGGAALAEAVKRAYESGQTDYYLEPMVRVDENGVPVGKIKDGDAVLFCCRRGEREIELTDAFTEEVFPHFAREKREGLDFVILTMYHDKYAGKLPIAFAPSKVEKPLAQVLSERGLTQLHCAESEKFAHVTFFFNGGCNEPFPGEEDIRIPSPKGVPFDTVPELSLPEVADNVIQGLEKGYDFIVTNFANGDVIGHTSSCDAKIACAGFVDTHLARVIETARKENYVIAVTADHGNLELMLNAEGKPHVAHTTNLVPFVMIDPMDDRALPLSDGTLGDVAPTVLQVLGIEKPAEMTGSTLAPQVNFGKNRKMLLIILDGWGFGAKDRTDPIWLGETPKYDAMLEKYPPSRLRASGEAVGLGAGKPGNSEAGHINIGSGRCVLQDDVRLDRAMEDGSFERSEVFRRAIEEVRQRGKALHLLALLTKKSSHGSIDYALALLKMAKDLPEVYVHIIFDGRSTEPGSAPALLLDLEEKMKAIGQGQIVDGVGRGIALDRDQNWTKIQKVYEALTDGSTTPQY